MITGRDIVIIGIQSWDTEIGSNCKNIAVEFAKHNRVLYVNEPMHRLNSLMDLNFVQFSSIRGLSLKKTSDNIRRIGDNIWTLYPARLIESINWIPESPLYDYLNKRNNLIFHNEIKNAIKRLNFKDIILFNDNQIFLGYYAVEFLQPKLSIYYIRDYLTCQSYFAKHGKKIEPILAEKYDAVVANSDYLAAYLKRFTDRSFMVGQGCDLSKFDVTKRSLIPEDIKNIPKPIVGYLGAITGLRLDISLIESIARRLPEVSIVLVGPEDNSFIHSRLHDLRNVYFLGAKSTDKLPSYIASFDVAINPQKLNELTIGNYPRKIDEYLAMGKPVVAANTEAMKYFSDYVYLSNNTNEFIQLIRKALKEDNENLAVERIAFAKSHTWEKNVSNIYDVMEDTLKAKELIQAFTRQASLNKGLVN